MKIDLPKIDFTTLGITSNFSVQSMQVRKSLSTVNGFGFAPTSQVLFKLFTKQVSIPKNTNLLINLDGELDKKVFKNFYFGRVNKVNLPYDKYYKLRQAYFKGYSSAVFDNFSSTLLGNDLNDILISHMETSYTHREPTGVFSGYFNSSLPDTVMPLSDFLTLKKPPTGYGFIASSTIIDSGSKLSAIAVSRIRPDSTLYQQVYFNSFLTKLGECTNILADYFVENFLTIDTSQKIYNIVSTNMSNFGVSGKDPYRFFIPPPSPYLMANLLVNNVYFDIYYHIEDL